MKKRPEISVVIPVKNGAMWLDACIQGIMNQSLFHQTEIITIDSGSTDDSLAILKKYPVRTYTIDPAEYNHGLTRNFGVELCMGKYVVMTVQDARPTDDLWLQKLVSGFSAEQNVAGVCGHQVVPHDRDKNPVEWFRPQNNPKLTVYQYKSADEFNKLSPLQKMYACGWDDVTAMYRREVLEQIPFKEIAYGEDAIWAKEALLAGYTLVYNPAATMYHYHHLNWDFTFRRTLTVMHLRYKQFGCIYNRPKQSLREVASMVKTILKSKPLTLKEKWSWFLFNRLQLKARQHAHKVFSEALNQSQQKLDEVHEKICDKPPVPLLSMSISNKQEKQNIQNSSHQ